MILWPRVTHFIYALSFACTSVECKWVQKTSSFAPEQNWGTPLTHTSYLVFTHNHVSYVVVGKQQITLMDKILSHAEISEKMQKLLYFLENCRFQFTNFSLWKTNCIFTLGEIEPIFACREKWQISGLPRVLLEAYLPAWDSLAAPNE